MQEQQEPKTIRLSPPGFHPKTKTTSYLQVEFLLYFEGRFEDRAGHLRAVDNVDVNGIRESCLRKRHTRTHEIWTNADSTRRHLQYLLHSVTCKLELSHVTGVIRSSPSTEYNFYQVWRSTRARVREDGGWGTIVLFARRRTGGELWQISLLYACENTLKISIIERNDRGGEWRG